MAQQNLPPAAASRVAKAPFFFNSSAHLIRILRERAYTLGEFAQALAVCPDDSIFQHTFQTLQEHHYIREGFSNDFGHWAFAACNEVALAEQLSALDVREFTFLNTDLTVHLHRAPVGPWTGIAAETSIGPDGVGTCSAVLHDSHGAFGRSAQILMVRPRG